MLDKKLNYPILSLNFKEAFDQLTQEEKLYTYYFSKACWEGAPIVLFQISYESPPLFIIFQSFFSSFQPFDELKKIIFLKSGGKITDVDYKQFIHYAAKFYSNTGNYSSFGNLKFIPELDCEKFEEILKCSSNYNEIKYIWDCIVDYVYDNSTNFKTINLTERQGKNSYYLGDIKEEDIKTIDKFLQGKDIENLNTRLMKISPSKFCYLVASVEERIEEWENSNIIGYYGEFSTFLSRTNENLRKAKEFCANETQSNMIDCYIESFKTGSIKKHIESQRWWVKDKKPVVETNIGWIETYIDPMGVRAYFQGFVALTDKDKTRKFNTLVDHSEKFIASLPWSKDFEKTNFISPDFTALDVVCFASNGCPIGINIPNYSEVQETDGFKNISISNAYPKFAADNLFFCNEKDIELLTQLGQSYVMHVACHELLGHGTGKLFRRSKIGSNYEFNFDIENVINPLTNDKIDSWYEENETYESKFTDIARFLEELRADLCGLYFTFFNEIHEIFEFNESLYQDTIYSLWLLYIRKGLLGLEIYNDEVKRWGQAHTQGAWVFVQFILENQVSGQEILIIQLDDEKKQFSINLNKNMILCYGQDLVSRILTSIHIWKCTGNFEQAKVFADKYSAVNEHFLKIRKIVSDISIPRRLELFHNLELGVDSNVSIKLYPETLEGIINSYVDRYSTNLNNDIYSQWTKYDTNFFK